MYGTSKKFLSGYLAEFLWKREVKRNKRDPFLAVFQLLSSAYKVWQDSGDHAYSVRTVCPSQPEPDHTYAICTLLPSQQLSAEDVHEHTYSVISKYSSEVESDHTYSSITQSHEHNYTKLLL